MDARIVAAGDSAWLIELPDRLDEAVNARAIAIGARIDQLRVPWITDIVVGYRSVMVYVEPLHEADPPVVPTLEAIAAETVAASAVDARHVTVPVCYGGEFGPDLPGVAAFAGLSHADVIARHTARAYRVYMVGFVPGFAYMASVEASIAAPRRSTPRVRVPPGSVAIAGKQTGVYPAATPGGWNIIGRSPVRPCDPFRAEPFLFRAGDLVRFRAITADEYRATTEWGDA